MFRIKNNTKSEAIENKFEYIIITQQGIAKTTSLNLKYISRLPSLEYLHVDDVSRITLQIKKQRQLLQSLFLKENLKTI